MSLLIFIPVLSKSFLYLDPGSGSFILQVLIASLLAGMLFIKTFWSKITGAFRKSNPPDDADLPGSDGNSDEK